MKKLLNNIPIKNRLTSFFLGITLVTLLLVPKFLFHYFETGLEHAGKLSLLTETNDFIEAYTIDNSTPLPNSNVFTFALDKMPDFEVNGLNLLENVDLKAGEFRFVFSDDYFPTSNDTEVVLLLHRRTLDDGRSLFSVAKFNLERTDPYITKWIKVQERVTLSILFGYLGLVVLALWYYSRGLGKQTTQLLDWAEQVSVERSGQVRPEFKFDEFNRIATCLEQALEKNASLVEREQKFLSHASHELRTPIAIIRANMEILARIDLSELAKEPLDRIDRASNSMQLLTETLLWLGRQSETPPTQRMLDIAALLTRLIDEQSYLIQDESVEVICDFAHAPSLVLPSAPLMIVLNNLIRNAFQYTHQGWIKVSFHDNQISIENHDTHVVEDEDVVSFGLGLELTQKVCNKLGWTLVLEPGSGGMTVNLILPQS